MKIQKYDPRIDIVQEIENKGSFQIVSLGDHCLIAKYLSFGGLRNCSYPFDWIESSAQMILHCLKDDFQSYLKLDAGIFYGNMIGKEIFHHHDVKQSLDYHKRCVERFKNLQYRKQKAFVATCYWIEVPIWEEIAMILKSKYIIVCPIHIICLKCNSKFSSDMIHIYHWHDVKTSRADLSKEDQTKFLNFFHDEVLK